MQFQNIPHSSGAPKKLHLNSGLAYADVKFGNRFLSSEERDQSWKLQRLLVRLP